MANYIVTDEELTSIANAIRSKSGESEQLEFPDGFISEVNEITAKISRVQESGSFSTSAAIRIEPKKAAKLSNTAYVDGNISPITSYTISTFPAGNVVKIFTIYENNHNYFYAWNSASEGAVNLPQNTQITYTYWKYSAKL